MRTAVGLMPALGGLRARASVLVLVATMALPEAAQATPAEPAHEGTVWVKVLVDVSGSMSARTPDGRTHFEALKQEFQTLSRSFNEAGSKSCPIQLELEAFRSYPEQLNADSVAACLPPASRTANGTSGFFTKRQAPKPVPPSGFPTGLGPEGALTDTPLSTAFQVAADELAQVGRSTDARILLLATDGVPSCRRRSPDCASGWCEFAQEQLRDEFREQWTQGAGQRVCSAAVSTQSLGTLEYSVFPLPGLSPACAQYAAQGLRLDGDGSIDKAQLTLLLKEAASRACVKDCEGDACRPPPIPPCPPEPSFSEVVAVGVSGRSRCTGVLLSPSAVLTARHCVPATEVLAGDSITRPEARRAVTRTVLPPDARLDAALLWLDRPIDTAIRPWKSEAAPIAQAGGVHVGFGASSPSGELGFGDKHVTLLSLVDAGCTAQQALHSGCNPAFEWALRGSPGYDTCSGDSGGGLYEAIFDGRQCRDAYGRVRLVHDWRLRGITSRSLAGSMSACGAGGIYTRLDVLTPWLEQVLPQANL